MKILTKIRSFFKRNYVCPKCNSPTYGKLLCVKCNEYVRIVDEQKKSEIEAKEELKRRNWVKIRDDFLKKKR